MTAAILSPRTAAEAGAPPAPKTVTWEGFEVGVGMCRHGVAAEWRALERSAVGSIFQSFDYVDVWCRAAAAEAGEQPVIVTGRRAGKLAFVLPLAVRRRRGARVLAWLAQGCANYGMALYEAEAFAGLDATAAERLLRAVARLSGASVVHLEAQPLHWRGFDNLFARSKHSSLGPNDTFVLPLDEDFKAQHGRLFSSSARSGLNRKKKRLAQDFEVQYDPVELLRERAAMLDWFLAEKRRRLCEKGRPNVFSQPVVRDLLALLAAGMEHFDIDVLRADGSPIAMAMTIRAGQAACLLNTAHGGAQFARYSPGALLLHWLVAAMHERGVRVFDFGPGDLTYKREWKPEIIPMMTTTFAVSPLGLPASASLAVTSALKRKVKRDERLLALAMKLNRRYDRLRGWCP